MSYEIWNSDVGDCIHLHACRRLSKSAEKYKKKFPRHCGRTCTAYETEDDFLDEHRQYPSSDSDTPSSLSRLVFSV